MFRIWAVAIRSKQCRYFRSGFCEFCVFPIDDLQVIWMFEEKMITGFLDKCDKIYMEWKPRKCSFIICLPFLSAIFWWGDMDRFSIKTPQNLTCLPCYSLCVKLRTGKCTLLFIMVYRVLWFLKALWIILSEPSIFWENLCDALVKFYHRFMYIAPSSGGPLPNLNFLLNGF